MATDNKIELTKEVEQISKSRSLALGANFKLDLALLAAEAVICHLDPKLNFVCEQWESLNLIEPLVSSLGINDLVINGRHIDVRVADDENYVSISKSILGSSLLTSGSLVVKFDQNTPLSGAIVAYVPTHAWTQLKEKDGSVSCKIEIEPDFSLVATLKSIFKRVQTDQAPEKKPTQEELNSFLQSPASSSSLRNIVAALCSCQDTREKAMDMAVDLPLYTVKNILHKAAAWNHTCDNIVISLSAQFKNVKPAEIKKMIQALGEKFGGQPEAPDFMNTLLHDLVQAELSKKFSVRLAEKAKSLSSKLSQGGSLNDSIKSLVNNSAAVDIAFAIKETRSQMENFVCATVEEIGAAFQKLALQPVYATHSKENEAGVDSINEVLELLEAHEIYERAEAIKKTGF